ncbi:MAG: hypothetical protein RJA19_1770, partial [Bacteroidota bacterium]
MLVGAMWLGGALVGGRTWAQAPTWMNPLEGSYVGRLELYSTQFPIYSTQAPAVEKSTSFVRLDGKRDASGDGFVLQWLQGRDS